MKAFVEKNSESLIATTNTQPTTSVRHETDEKRPTDQPTDRPTDRPTDQQTNRQTDRQIDRLSVGLSVGLLVYLSDLDIPTGCDILREY